MINGDFWSMGGYARYVWPCFAFTAVVLWWNLWSAHRLQATARRRAQRALAMADADRAGSPPAGSPRAGSPRAGSP